MDPAPAKLYFKIGFIFLLLATLGLVGYFFWNNYSQTKETYNTPLTNDKTKQEDAEGFAEDTNIYDFPEPEAIKSGADEKSQLVNTKSDKDPSDTSSTFNILVLGIDRRHGGQTNWRTDVVQLITISADRKSSVLTHIPRDVWAGTYKINAVYNLKGADAIKEEIQKITGQRPDRIIRVDFDAFAWAIDSVGGLTIDVPVGFTDENYPNDRNGKEELITVTFNEGAQTMDGERALVYVRSRKGNNGQGSDYARGTRQQLVMEAILDDYFRDGNVFNPKNAETLYRIATEKIYTDISISDTLILFELLKNYKSFRMEEVSLDTSNYLEVPASSAPYGGAWTLIPKGGSYQAVHDKITELLDAKL